MLSSWAGGLSGDLNNPVKACYAVIEPNNAEASWRLDHWKHNLAWGSPTTEGDKATFFSAFLAFP